MASPGGGAAESEGERRMPPGAVWMAAVVGGYVAAGATAKLLARAPAATALDVTIGRRWPWSRRSLVRSVGGAELLIAALAALPTSLQRMGLVLQAALVTTFVGFLVYARQASVPCGCFGARERRPTTLHVGAAIGVALAAFAVAVAPRSGGAVLFFGLGAGLLIGVLLAVQAEGLHARRAAEQSSPAELSMTRRGVLVGGLSGLAAFVAAMVFGWQRSAPAGAEGAHRRVVPRLPLETERAAAMASASLHDLLAEHGGDVLAVRWDQALAYEDRWPDRTIVSIVAPIAGSAFSAVHAAPRPGIPVEAAGLLQADRTGWVQIDQQSYAFDRGNLVVGPSVETTARDFSADLSECLGNVAPAAIEICCALCGFAMLISGPVAGACCGGCAIGAVIGCLWVSIT